MSFVWGVIVGAALGYLLGALLAAGNAHKEDGT